MIIFPNAKINLGLNILSKRKDGYHNISSIFYPVRFLFDALEILPSKRYRLLSSGIKIPGNPNENICNNSYQLLKELYSIPAVTINLYKRIPTGTGLGGGSADASFTLLALNSIFDLKLSVIQLQNLAAQIGSDCPFFINNKPAWVTGRGETIQNSLLCLNNYKLVIISTGVHISTKEAYSLIKPDNQNIDLGTEILKDPGCWKNIINNDFESVALIKYPEIQAVKDKLYDAGALYASMTGSGSAVYGIFDKNNNMQYSYPEKWKIWKGSL
jgi:4-diphosphocytidyl-2-C-methyl-D-erythritol kinase